MGGLKKYQAFRIKQWQTEMTSHGKFWISEINETIFEIKKDNIIRWQDKSI